MARGTTNKNVTGSSYDRRRRRQWLLDQFGDGTVAACKLRCSKQCERTVDIHTLSVNRVVPGCEGGKYTRDNIEPACAACNTLDGALLGVARKAKLHDLQKHKASA